MHSDEDGECRTIVTVLDENRWRVSTLMFGVEKHFDYSIVGWDMSIEEVAELHIGFAGF